MKTAYFSLGCFWSPQLEFEKIKGVKKAEVGYCGGNDPNTTYEKVCSGSTDHAETIKVEFDENVVSYEELVRFFFKETSIIFFLEFISKFIIFFLRSFVFNKSEIKVNSEPKIYFLKLEILNFSSTNKTRLVAFFLLNVFL